MKMNIDERGRVTLFVVNSVKCQGAGCKEQKVKDFARRLMTTIPLHLKNKGGSLLGKKTHGAVVIKFELKVGEHQKMGLSE